MLTKAREAAYDDEALKDVPPAWRQAHFTVLRAKPPRTYRLNSEIRELVRLARLNLMEPWPMKGPFDVIFCRNVMIYFDKPTQQELVRRFRDMLVLGGYLMVGHSESLTAFAHSFQYVQPAVYSK
jgi:chemotaxis protein methyltransferase CheR